MHTRPGRGDTATLHGTAPPLSVDNCQSQTHFQLILLPQLLIGSWKFISLQSDSRRQRFFEKKKTQFSDQLKLGSVERRELELGRPLTLQPYFSCNLIKSKFTFSFEILFVENLNSTMKIFYLMFQFSFQISFFATFHLSTERASHLV